MNKIILIMSSLALLFLVFTLKNKSRTVDERVFYDGVNLKLKLVKIQEKLPFHYSGNSLRVQCKSQNTNDSVQTDSHKRGWQDNVPIQTGIMNQLTQMKMNIQLKGLIDIAKEGYHVIDESIVILHSGPFLFVSWDQCRSFQKSKNSKIEDMKEIFFHNLDTDVHGMARAEIRYLSSPEVKRHEFLTTDFGKTWSIKDF